MTSDLSHQGTESGLLPLPHRLSPFLRSYDAALAAPTHALCPCLFADFRCLHPWSRFVRLQPASAFEPETALRLRPCVGAETACRGINCTLQPFFLWRSTPWIRLAPCHFGLCLRSPWQA